MILNNIKEILEKEQFTCSLFSANEQSPLERLIIFLGLDPKKRERLLEVIVNEQLTFPKDALTQGTFLPSRIQFRLALPFEIQDLALNQVASLILFLNQLIGLPGFELDELNGKVFYRYIWIIKEDMIDSSLIMSIISALMLNLELFSEIIESLSEGKISFNDILSQIVQLSQSSRSFNESLEI